MPPTPLESSTTTQTVSQVQISSCLSHCQNIGQVQVSVQESVTVQVAGTAAQSATGLETQPSPSAFSQVTSSVTQIQIGCIFECFGTTTTDSSTAALTQQFLSDLTSLQPACESPTTQATLATLESVIDQVACQVQAAGTTATQTEVASQSATTVQVTDSAPASQLTVPQSIAEAQQGTWQLQIGCVFYCADTQQVQQAQQSITIIHVQTGLPGSGPGEVDVIDQIIRQVQVGCIAWCYDATQVQVVGGQSTVIVDESPAPASPPSPQPPPSSTPPTPAAGPPPPAEQSGPAAGPSTATAPGAPPAAGPPPATSSSTWRVLLRSSIAPAGGSVATLSTPVAPVAPVSETTVMTVSTSRAGKPASAVHLSSTAMSRPVPRRPRHPSARPQADRPVQVAEAVAADRGAPSDLPVIALALAAAAALIALAAVWTQTPRKPER